MESGGAGGEEEQEEGDGFGRVVGVADLGILGGGEAGTLGDLDEGGGGAGLAVGDAKSRVVGAAVEGGGEHAALDGNQLHARNRVLCQAGPRREGDAGKAKREPGRMRPRGGPTGQQVLVSRGPPARV